MAGKYNISSASAKLRSSVHVKAVSPIDRPTCGVIMTEDQAIELASYILAVAGPSNAKGLIYVTGRPEENTVTVIRGMKLGRRSSRLFSLARIRYSGPMAADLRDLDPAELRLPSSRSSGADPGKLQRQIAKHGTSTRRDAALACIRGV
jgi:hypothetical protein